MYLLCVSCECTYILNTTHLRKFRDSNAYQNFKSIPILLQQRIENYSAMYLLILHNCSPITQELYFYSKNVQNLLPVLGFEEYYFLIAFFFLILESSTM